MKIINSLIVAGLLTGSAWADDVIYLIDLDRPNAITSVQRQGNYYYYSSGNRSGSACEVAPSRSSRSALWRETFGDLLE